MSSYESHRERLKSFFGPTWEPLADAIDDTDFHSILSQNEKQILQQFKSDREAVRSYPDQLSAILSKYLTWKIYTNTGLKKLSQDVNRLEIKVKESNSSLETIENSAKYISGATALVEYSKAFAKRAKDHEVQAEHQSTYYSLSLFGFAIIIALSFFFSVAEIPLLEEQLADDIGNLPLNTGVLAIKILLIIFAYQITQFFRKNYGAEKHLQEVYQHRSDVLQSLHAVYEALKDNPEERAKILSAGALFAYERGETGYITTKEGAGSAGDGLIDTLLTSIVSRR
jgi:hypothetical protein